MYKRIKATIEGTGRNRILNTSPHLDCVIGGEGYSIVKKIPSK
jgi:hypothetical protein